MAIDDEQDDHGVATVRYGWCMAGDHDTAKGRGGCPIQVSSLPACPCECHKGAREARGYLAVKKPRLAGDDLPAEASNPKVTSGATVTPSDEPEKVAAGPARRTLSPKKRQRVATGEEPLI